MALPQRIGGVCADRLRTVTAALVCGAVLSPVTPAVAAAATPFDEQVRAADQAAGSSESDVSSLRDQISASEDEMANLQNELGTMRERVNKTLVDLHDAQANAESARQDAAKAKDDLDQMQKAVEKAQGQLDDVARSEYVHRNVIDQMSQLAGQDPATVRLDRKTFLRQEGQRQTQVTRELQDLRAKAANSEAELRQAKEDAEGKEQEAQSAQEQAQQDIKDVSERTKAQSDKIKDLTDKRDAAQKRLEDSRAVSDALKEQQAQYRQDQADQKKAQEEAAKKAGQRRAQIEAQRANQERIRKAANAAAAKNEADRQAAAREEAQKMAKSGSQEDAAAAMVGAATADHDQLNDPYPIDSETASGNIAAVENGGNASGGAGQSGESEQTSGASETSTRETSTPSATTSSKPKATTSQKQTTGGETSASKTTSTKAKATPTTTSAAQPSTPKTTSKVPSKQTAPATTPKPTPKKDGSKNYDDVTKEASKVVTGSRDEKIETVIRRAKSQLGVTYAWGGGNANGPTLGIRDGGVADSYGDYAKVGFDCSGLVVYAFAGVGIALPHYTGYQYQRGTKVPPSQMQRGDLIFYGPNAETHVAIYLGDGTMIEAPESGSTVKISPVRWPGMSPSVVRLL